MSRMRSIGVTQRLHKDHMILFHYQKGRKGLRDRIGQAPQFFITLHPNTTAWSHVPDHTNIDELQFRCTNAPPCLSASCSSSLSASCSSSSPSSQSLPSLLALLLWASTGAVPSPNTCPTHSPTCRPLCPITIPTRCTAHSTRPCICTTWVQVESLALTCSCNGANALLQLPPPDALPTTPHPAPPCNAGWPAWCIARSTWCITCGRWILPGTNSALLWGRCDVFRDDDGEDAWQGACGVGCVCWKAKMDTRRLLVSRSAIGPLYLRHACQLTWIKYAHSQGIVLRKTW